MAISTTHAYVQYDGNSVTTAFTVTFQFFLAAELSVTLISAAGVETVKTITTHYTVSGGNGATGTVTMLTAPATGEKLRIERATAATQETTYALIDRFSTKSLNNPIDRRELRTQEIELKANRALKLPLTDYIAGTGGYDAGGFKIENAAEGTADDDLVTKSQMESAIADATIAILPDGSVSFDLLQDVAALSVVGRASNTSGVLGAITAGNDGEILRRSGTSIGFGSALATAVNFTAAGTGAATRTSQDKHRERVTAADFGAVADFSFSSQSGTNNATAFQNLLDAIPDGGKAEVGPGNFKLSSTLSLTGKEFVIEGAGTNSTFLVFDDCDGFDIDNSAATKTITFRNMTLVSTANGTRTAVTYAGLSTFSVLRTYCYFDNVAWCGADILKGSAWTPNVNENMCHWLKPVSITDADGVYFTNPYMLAQHRSFIDGWPTNSIGIELNNVTEFWADNPRIYRFQDAITVDGTSEGIRIKHGQLVANRRGYTCASDSAPANNHVLDKVHIASYDYNIDLGTGGANTAISHVVDGCALYKRDDSVTAVFTHVKLNTHGAVVRGNYFLNSAGYDGDEIAVDVQDGDDNSITGNIFHRQATLLQTATTARATLFAMNQIIDASGSDGETAIVDNNTSADTKIFMNWGSSRITRLLQVGGGLDAEYAAGSHLFMTGANRNPSFKVLNGGTTTVNYLEVFGSAAAGANGGAIRALGSDTDINITLIPKGTGALRTSATITPTSAGGAGLGTSVLPFSSINLSRAGLPATLINSTDNALQQVLSLEGDRATPTDGDTIYLSFRMSDDGGTQTEFVRISARALDVSDTTEDGDLTFGMMVAGSMTNKLLLDNTTMRPVTNAGLALGDATRGYSGLFLSTAASSVGTGTKTISNSADSSTNFGKYFSISLNGVTVYVPCGTVAPT